MFDNRILSIATGLVLFANRSLLPQSEPVAWTNDQVQQILKNRIEGEKQSVGIVVGLVGANGNQVIGYGSVRKNGAAIKPDGDTVFEIGSVTKVFTSLLLADMVERGEVALGDRVTKYLPKTVTMPTREGREITLLDLATHTSALPRLPTHKTPMQITPSTRCTRFFLNVH